ncbi:MAG: 50S ribosomal protein L7ae-like protein [Clostridium cadaveris]|uniref:50S ribosomal protein L7ae-like protein n=1 Tax=Clostridium cadaveris TaxID=1529 RepID=A0A316MAI7_9CLOT|nr:MAG: 50S ribosomal protein L7ae-like protein [Clostridium cadaveris]
MNKFFGFLGLTKKSGNLVEGYNKCEEYIKKSKPSLLILSKEISQNTRKKFSKYCEEKQIPFIENIDKYSLGMALGREEISVIIVKNKKMADKLLNLWKEEKCESEYTN